MNQKRWDSKQKKLFRLYFTNKEAKENGINIKRVIQSIHKYHLKWEEFYFILRKYSPELSQFSSIDKIKLIHYDKIDYLIIKIYHWTYLCIDLIHKKVVSFLDGLNPFDESFFVENFDEEEVEEPENIYYSIDFLDDGIHCLIDFIIDNEELFLTSPCFKYKIESSDEFMTFLDFSISKGDLTLYFGDKYMLSPINCINIDENLMPIDVSSLTGNLNLLKRMCVKLKNIQIPIDIIPNFVLENII